MEAKISRRFVTTQSLRSFKFAALATVRTRGLLALTTDLQITPWATLTAAQWQVSKIQSTRRWLKQFWACIGYMDNFKVQMSNKSILSDKYNVNQPSWCASSIRTERFTIHWWRQFLFHDYEALFRRARLIISSAIFKIFCAVTEPWRNIVIIFPMHNGCICSSLLIDSPGMFLWPGLWIAIEILSPVITVSTQKDGPDWIPKSVVARNCALGYRYLSLDLILLSLEPTIKRV